jgi:glycolate oxidase iron-sulfur subunit
MQHSIQVDGLGPVGEVMANAVEKCVHCGFCLPACPTYSVLNEEMDSPRGRIVLMKSVLEGNVELEDALLYVDRCLGCMSCVTACPSGVPYGELITPFRSYAQGRRKRPIVERIKRRVVQETLPHPGRFRMAAHLGNLTRPLRGLLPSQFSAMIDLLPEALPPVSPLPEVYPANGKKRARVALLAGCVQQALAPEINWATLRVLSYNGVEVFIPTHQGCCGGLALHTGETNQAQEFAKRIMSAFLKDVDAVITNAAGCGSTMHEYPLLFKGMAEERFAEEFSGIVMDVSAFLDALGLIETPELSEPLTLAYQDACHLAHAQGVTSAPRNLLNQVGGVNLVPIDESDICCGSAGTYNLEQPDTAYQLGQRKVKNILKSGAQAVVSGNIGCIVQLTNHLRDVEHPIPVFHTIELMDKAYLD